MIAWQPAPHAEPQPVRTPGDARLWLWVVEVPCWLYLVLSGTTDAASGLAGMAGTPVRAEFRMPWGATDSAEFWRRRYASLHGWLAAYVYRPLGGAGRHTRGVHPGTWRRAATLVSLAWIPFLLPPTAPRASLRGVVLRLLVLG